MRRLQKIPFTVTTTGVNFLTGTATTPSISGFLRGLKVASPAVVENAATLATVITDDEGDTIAIAAGFATQAVNTKVRQFADLQTQPNQLEYPVAGKITITCTLSANQTVGRIITGYLLVDNLI